LYHSETNDATQALCWSRKTGISISNGVFRSLHEPHAVLSQTSLSPERFYMNVFTVVVGTKSGIVVDSRRLCFAVLRV